MNAEQRRYNPLQSAGVPPAASCPWPPPPAKNLPSPPLKKVFCPPPPPPRAPHPPPPPRGPHPHPPTETHPVGRPPALARKAPAASGPRLPGDQDGLATVRPGQPQARRAADPHRSRNRRRRRGVDGGRRRQRAVLAARRVLGARDGADARRVS